MTREEARNLLRNSKSKGNNAHSLMLNEALEMAIQAIDTCDKLFKSYETLVDEIIESGDTKNATKRVDDWCVEQLRNIISDHYAEMVMEDSSE